MWPRNRLLGLTCVVLVSALASCASKSTSSTGVSVLGGLRGLNADTWDPADQQIVYGIEVDSYRKGKLGWEAGLAQSSGDGTRGVNNVDASLVEAYGGVRKTWGSRRFHPYLAAGVSVLNADLDQTAAPSVDDNSLGGYVRGGAYYDVTSTFYVGIDVRAQLFTSLELRGSDVDADYWQAGVVLGFRLPQSWSEPDRRTKSSVRTWEHELARERTRSGE